MFARKETGRLRVDEVVLSADVIATHIYLDFAVETIVETYLEVRQAGERFVDTYARVGDEPFKERLYAAH